MAPWSTPIPRASDEAKAGEMQQIEEGAHVRESQKILSVIERPEAAEVVKPGAGIELREVSVGVSNDKFVEVTHGIESGDAVLLNPRALLK